MRNSWGEVFGNEGFARVLKGNGGALGIESDCYWANGEVIWKTNSGENEETKLPEREDPVDQLMDELFEGSAFKYRGLIPDSENPYSLSHLPD